MARAKREHFTELQLRALAFLEDESDEGSDELRGSRTVTLSSRYLSGTAIQRDFVMRGLITPGGHGSRVVPNAMNSLARRGYIDAVPTAFVRGFTTGTQTDHRRMYRITEQGRERLREIRALML